MKVGIQARLKNGILWEAAKKLGSQSALARYLGLSPTEVGAWINFQHSPLGVDAHSKRPEGFFQEIENKLFELTGHTLEEIFPPEIRTQAFLKRQKKIDAIVEMPVEQLIAAGAMPLLSPAPDELLFNTEVEDVVAHVVDTLSEREARIVRMRFGLNGESEHTLDEVAQAEHVTQERIRQIEARALRKLRHKSRSRHLKSYAEYSGEGVTLGDYHPEPHKFPAKRKSAA